MSDQKVSDLADGGAVQVTDEFYAERAGSQVKILGSEFGGSQPTLAEVLAAGGDPDGNPITGPVTITPTDPFVSALHVEAVPGSINAVTIKRPNSEALPVLAFLDEADSPYGAFSSGGCFFETQRGNDVPWTLYGGHRAQHSLNLSPQRANLQEWWHSSDDTGASSFIGPMGEATFGTAEVRAFFLADPNTSNLVLYLAQTPGTGGNSITVAYVNDGASQPLSVSVVGDAITVHLATDGASVITSTADDVVAAVAADGAAAALVVVGRFVGTDGTALIEAAMTAQSLTGGADAPSPLTLKNGADVVASVTATGAVVIGANAAPADADLSAGQCAFWFDSTDGASALKIKAKTADGTVATATVPLT